MTGPKLETRSVEDQEEVHEIDGPPRAYFEIPIRGESLGLKMGPTDVAFVERITYHAFRLVGATREGVEARRDQVLQLVTSEIRKFGGGIIWWRRRPSAPEWEGPGDTGHVAIRLRLGTSPRLDDRFWKRINLAVENSVESPA